MNRKSMIRFSAFILAVMAMTLAIQPAMAQRPYIQNFDLNRYLGTWYEIARFPHSFEEGLVGVTATYSVRPDGKINVENAGYRGTLDGPRDVAAGKAKMAGRATDGHLKVSFFLFFYADYFIMDLDPEYRWALIGSRSDKYLWILSRSPKMEEQVYEMILGKARSLGYDLSELYKVPHRDFTPFSDRL
jgi:lipocalin